MGISFDPAREDVLEQSATYGTLTVGTSAVELKVGASALSSRQAVTMLPITRDVYWGYNSSVTTSTGTKLFKGQFLMLPIGPTVTVYLIAASAGTDVRIGELS